MQDLQELVQLLTKNKLRSIELLENESDADNMTKMRELYEGILKGQFKTDQEAAEYFYGKDETFSTYQNLRSSLKNRLVNTMFFINTKQPSYTERQRAYYECNREWAATKILLANNARLVGISMCHKLLKIAKKFEFTELVLDISRSLRLHYSTRMGDLKKFELYNSQFKEYEKIWQEENLAEELYNILVVRYINSKGLAKETYEMSTAFLEQLKDAVEKYQSYKLYLCYTLIENIKYSCVGDYDGIIRACNRAIAFFESRVYLADTPLQIFLHQLLVCHLQQKQFEEGRIAAEKCLKLSTNGHINWFKFQELYFLLSMHSRKYEQAYAILQEVVNHSRFTFQPSIIKETWRIFEAYLQYLVEIGKLEIPAEDNTSSKFRVGKFLNETPIFSRDKRGMHIPILIIQILFTTLQKRYGEAGDKIETIDKYRSRYLKKDDNTFRSNCFIKMLLQLPISDFHKAGTIRRAKPYLHRLKEVSLDVTNQSHEIEVIPYEDLWELAIDTLDQKFHKSRKAESSFAQKRATSKM